MCLDQVWQYWAYYVAAQSAELRAHRDRETSTGHSPSLQHVLLTKLALVTMSVAEVAAVPRVTHQVGGPSTWLSVRPTCAAGRLGPMPLDQFGSRLGLPKLLWQSTNDRTIARVRASYADGVHLAISCASPLGDVASAMTAASPAGASSANVAPQPGELAPLPPGDHGIC